LYDISHTKTMLSQRPYRFFIFFPLANLDGQGLDRTELFQTDSQLVGSEWSQTQEGERVI